MKSHSVKTLTLLAGLAQCDSVEDLNAGSEPVVLQQKSAGVDLNPVRFRNPAPSGYVEHLPSVDARAETWVDAIGVRDALRDCLQQNHVVCAPSSTDLTCFSRDHGDHVPVNLRVVELGGEPATYDIHVYPIFQGDHDYSYMTDASALGRDGLALACQTGQHILSAGDQAAEWCFEPEDPMSCDLWMTSAFIENEALTLRFEWLLSLAGALSSSGWHFKLGNNGFSLTVSDLLSSPVSFSVEWDYRYDQPTVLLQASGPLDWNAFWCESPCYPEDAVRVLDSNAFLSTVDSPIWMIPYAVYPVSFSF